MDLKLTCTIRLFHSGKFLLSWQQKSPWDSYVCYTNNCALVPIRIAWLNTLTLVHTHTHMHAHAHARTHTHTHTHTHAHTHAHTPAPRSITPDMVITSGSANPLNVNFTITFVS